MSDKNDEKTTAPVDKELDDLLNSALQDMTKKPDTALPTDLSVPSGEGAPQNMWSEQFIQEAAAQFESNMAAILGSFSGVPEDQISQDQIAATFSKMAEAAAQVMQTGKAPATEIPEVNATTDDPPLESAEGDSEVTAAIAQTLQSLSTNADNLQNPFSDADIANMLTNLNLDGASDSGPNMFVPFMQGMMQSLLSKEVLYPSLKDLLDKYPAWLQENGSKLEASELERFKKQQDLMSRVCAALEDEQETDPEDVKRKRFETVLELMQKMQDLGQPPTELVGDLGAAPQGFAPPPGMGQDQCSIM